MGRVCFIKPEKGAFDSPSPQGVRLVDVVPDMSAFGWLFNSHDVHLVFITPCRVRLVGWQPPRGALVGAVTAQGGVWYYGSLTMVRLAFPPAARAAFGLYFHQRGYDTHLLETIDSNTTPDSTNMCHRGGEIVQDAEQVKSPLLNAEVFKTKDMVEKEVYNELSNIFLQLEKYCISLEISIKQKEESFQSNKPCKNQGFPEFHKFFVINDLKAQLQAKTTLICDLKNQIKSVKDASNEAKVKNDIDVIETINIELEHSVPNLLATNEQLHKESEHLKQTYKELYDSIKKTRVQNKDNNDPLISQINQKSVENDDLKVQIQEKVFANAALKNELRKLKGNSVETKFAKASILGKTPLQPSRTHLVVRQPNAFTSERPRISRPRFASKVDEKNDLSKIVTPHYLPKVRESAPVKPHHVNAPSSSRNSQKELDLASARTHRTPNACIPNPRNISRCLHVSKSSCVPSNVVPLVDHSRNSSFFSDSKHFVCSTCQKCVFNENHDDCITKFLKEVNSHAMVKSHKTRNNNKPVEPKSHTQKPGRQIVIGQMFSLNKSSAMHEKPHTPRSCLRWKPTGRIFKTVGLRWIPTGKMFTDSTTNVDSEPLNGSNDDIANPYECDQTLYFSAGTFNSSAGTSVNPIKERLRVWLPKRLISHTLGVHISSGLVLHQMTLDHSSSSLGPHCLMTSVHISSGLVLHQMTLDHSSSSLSPHCLMTSVHISSGLVLHQMMLDHSSSRLGPHCLMTFEQNSSGLVLHQITFEQIGSSLVLQSLMSFDHISSSLVPQCQMASAGISSGLAPQRKEKCTLQCALSLKEEKSSYTMAEENIPAPTPTRTYNTNFFRAFTTSANVPSIYIQLPYTLPLSIQLTYSCHLLLVKRMHVNNQHQPWRAIPFLINRCFTGKTSGSDKPRNPVLQILHIHRRSELPMHVTGDDFPLGNLKLVPKGEKDEVFGMPILKHLITEAIQQLPYYQQY
ncbi:hypothetical protein Tco_0892749 [Tanacetum coccineum]|uniref:Uncharacterized protein n=1 Tax=Tanacetum coccineum TaxID=301880 RepID=A0ABQ5C9R1_9ASTR